MARFRHLSRRLLILMLGGMVLLVLVVVILPAVVIVKVGVGVGVVVRVSEMMAQMGLRLR